MCISRTRSTECIENECLSQRVGQVFLGSNHRCDTHHGVVHGHTKVVDRNTASTAQQDKVSDGAFGIPRNRTTHNIVDDHACSFWYFESNRIRDAFLHLLLHEFGVGVSPTIVVSRRDSCGLLLCAHFFQFFLGTETTIRTSFTQQSPCNLLVDDVSFTLTVRTKRSKRWFAIHWTFVPIESKPLQIRHDGSLGFLGRSCKIRIFHSDDKTRIFTRKVKLSFLCRKPIVQCSSGSSNMKTSCWTWSKTKSWWTIE
mmetsp:Transcript_10863/g.16605  ORF Transcript_10863/g.16605 Transcript_10863/m.16605 type:complete len:255 (+) Transcript_10863:1699-2463(+)